MFKGNTHAKIDVCLFSMKKVKIIYFPLIVPTNYFDLNKENYITALAKAED